LKIDQPSFFHSFHLTRGDGDSLLADVPSSLSEFAGNAFALPGELCAFLNSGIPHYNKPVPSSIADIHRTSHHTSGNIPPPKTKKGLRPCKQSEAMVKIVNFVELPVVCGALLESPKLLLRAFPFWSIQKLNRIIIKGMKRKISPSSLQRARGGSKTLSILSVGQFF